MVTNTNEDIGRIREAIKTADGLSDRDRDLLLSFDDKMGLARYSASRRSKLLKHCRVIAGGAERGPEETPDVELADVIDDRDAAERVVSWINRQYENEETNRDYRVAVRMLGKHVTDGDDVPDTLDWISSTTSRNYDPSPDPAQMLDWDDDVVPMLDACMNSRDRGLIATAWDSGARAGELLELSVGNVTDHKHGLQISVDGRQGQRSITLVVATPHLSRWLQDHPRGDDDTAPLWCKLQSGEEMTYHMARKIPREAADRAGVTKPVTFTNFRKSSASHLASQGVTQAVLEDHHGWSQGSDVASRYVSVFSEASDREIARAHGMDVSEDKPDPIAAITCPRCERETPRSEAFCTWCHQALEHGAVDRIEDEQETKRRELLAMAKENPELLDRLEEAEEFIEAVGGDPDVINSARAFADAVDTD